METIRIEILNPKAKALLKDLANLDLIRISKENSFSEVLKKIRSKSDEAPSLEEITKEVEAVRKARYEK
jgi:hypothetical protein